MKSKLGSFCLLLTAIVCLTGADSISYNAGQPNPNPGGVPSSIEANGTYTLDSGHTLSAVSFTADNGKISVSETPSASNGAWELKSVLLNKGTYDCTAQLAVDDGTKIWLADSAVAKDVIVK